MAQYVLVVDDSTDPPKITRTSTTLASLGGGSVNWDLVVLTFDGNIVVDEAGNLVTTG